MTDIPSEIQTEIQAQHTPARKPSGFIQRYREFLLISRDPVLFMSLLFSGIFLFIFVFFPLARAISGGFFNPEGLFDLTYFGRYIDSYYGPVMRQIFWSTIQMGILSSVLGTLLGFVFAFAMVRCGIPGARWVHLIAMVPTVSPPFAIALSTILLFGRNGLITRRLLGLDYNVYGMHGLVFVQVITFFTVAYLILRAMLERLNPSMEEAAESLGAGRLRVFRTVILPLLIPGLAGSMLLLFVESLADLGNPMFIAGNLTVLSTQIFLAVIGEFDYQKASALSLVLLIPTLVVFLLQRYYVNRRSYISVTGKPSGKAVVEKSGLIRWTCIIITYITCILIILLYATVVVSSFTTAWGVNFSLTLRWWTDALTRGIEAVLDTTFLSALATPLAALTGMVIAFLIVRKKFSGKGLLDFGSNLGGAVPGTILGIGFILAFNKGQTAMSSILYAVLALFFIFYASPIRRQQVLILILGTSVGLAIHFLTPEIELDPLLYVFSGIYLGIALFSLIRRKKTGAIMFAGIGVYLALYNLVVFVADPIAKASRQLEIGFWNNAVFQLSDYVKVPFQLPPVLLGIALLFISALVVNSENSRWRLPIGILALGLPCALFFQGMPLALTSTPYIILAAYIVRSLPASVRAGAASLQQIDPSIEEASQILGADAQYTFRKVTIPLILPALLAGLIFSFTRHMTSLSAIIFLVTARWRIVTASIMSDFEQVGLMGASAYSTIIIVLVLIAIGIMNLIIRRMLRGRGDVDLSMGA
ncbi:MAG: iron ABC transporter permease [Chloroflexi bacterium]|nr:MAG: iron ABC transporter permease [Chloroflexota bacterium]